MRSMKNNQSFRRGRTVTVWREQVPVGTDRVDTIYPGTAFEVPRRQRNKQCDESFGIAG